MDDKLLLQRYGLCWLIPSLLGVDMMEHPWTKHFSQTTYAIIAILDALLTTAAVTS